MVRMVISTKVDSCSTLANFHHRRQRSRFSGVSGKTYAPTKPGRVLLAGDRADQAGHVDPHAESLVPDPVALAEVLSTAGTRVRDGAHHQREAELGGELPEAGHGLR